MSYVIMQQGEWMWAAFNYIVARLFYMYSVWVDLMVCTVYFYIEMCGAIIWWSADELWTRPFSFLNWILIKYKQFDGIGVLAFAI